MLVSSNKQDWETPKWLFDKLNEEFRFTLDPCANDDNYKCNFYFTEEGDGLSRSWEGHIVFINPPYRYAKEWVTKAYNEFKENKVTCVLLIPARVDTKIWHEIIAPYATQIRFLKGRVRFVGAESGSTFPSAIVVFSYRRYDERIVFVDMQNGDINNGDINECV